MIEKIIHYVWLGDHEKPASVIKNIQTWQKYNPGYQLKEWNEENFDVNLNPFVSQAYRDKKYAFVSDYIRLYALYHDGGIYLDTDMVAYQSFDTLLDNHFFLTFEKELVIASSIIGSEKGNPIILDMLKTIYEDLTFDVSRMREYANTILITNYFSMFYQQIKWNGQEQVINNRIHFYPGTLLVNPGRHNISIHLFEASWMKNKSSPKSSLGLFLRRHSNVGVVRFFYNINHLVRGIQS